MDQSAAEVAIARAYGGSDSTESNFNRPAYVRFGSVHEPRDFGVVETLRLDIQGRVGAESGTQTLFFSFTTNKPAKIGLRRVRLNPRTDQYITIALRDPDGRQVPLGIDGYASSRLNDDFQIEQSLPVSVDIGYVECGYWDTGYAEYDCFRVLRPGRVLFSGDPDDSFEPFDAELLPAGRYTFTVSSSQWSKLPYRIQAVVAPQVDLGGQVGGSLNLEGRFTLRQLSGQAVAQLRLEGGVQRTLSMEGIADLALTLRATLIRQSPFE